MTEVREAWRLHDQRAFLRRSLEDAEREHEAGDLADDDYAALRRRDEALLARVEEELAGAKARPGAEERRQEKPRRTRKRRRTWLAIAGGVCVVAAVVLLVFELVSPRLPGEGPTGSIDLNTQQEIERQLTQAQTLVDHGKSSEALSLYGDVLTEDPKDPVALAEWGWLDWEAASQAKEQTVAAEGASALEEAVKLDKHLYAAQYYVGTVLYQEGDPAAAVTHYAQFLADKPTAKWLKDAAPTIRAAYAAAGKAVPAGVPG